MRKNYQKKPEAVSAKRLTHAFMPAVMLFAALLLVTILSGKLFAAAPTIGSFSPATGPVGTLVTINGTNLSTPTAFTIGGKSAVVVSNTGSVLVAMVMPGAATGAVSITTTGGTATSSGNFTVTPAKFPSVQQGAKLVGTGGILDPEQGGSTSLSADGNTAIMGGYRDNSQEGAAWLFIRSGSTWTQQGSKLVGAGSIGAALQGFAVSLSADGNTAIVGGYQDNSGVGAAWVYTRSGGVWTQQGSKLVGTDNIGAAQQGFSVSLSADGNTAIVGGNGDNSNQGAAWVYTRSGSVWTQQGSKLVGTGVINEGGQGQSVSLSADGNTAIVGGDGDNTGVGAAWIYTRSGSTWTQQGSKLVGTGSVGSDVQQGESVSLSADGNTAMVGGPVDNSATGAAWVYTRSDGTWTQQGSKLVRTGGTGGLLGQAVSLSADGNTAIVGGGAALVYTRIGSTWTQKGSELYGTGSLTSLNVPLSQGRSVSISADGNTVISGGPEDNSYQGAAWVFIPGASNDALLNAIKITPISALTNTGTTGTTTTYTTTVAGTTTSVTITPTVHDATATIKVDGVAVTSGTGSGAIALAVGQTTINTIVTARDGTTTHTYSIVVTRNPVNALLSTIKLTPASLLTNTGTTGTTTTYTTSVSSSTQFVSVTPTAADTHSTITVNSSPLLSGETSTIIALAEGETTTITTVVTGEDRTTTHTYIIMVTRLSNNAALSVIRLTPASILTNTGTTGSATNYTTTYTTTVAGATTSVTITPTAQEAHATIKVNGVTVASGTASASIALAAGAITTINIVSTAQDGTAMRTYSIAVTRLSNNALLSTIKLTPASILTNTGTTGTTTTYTTSVPNGTTSVTVTATTQDATATIKVNGTTVASGAASGSIALAAGNNTITTVVTARDGTTTHTYSITVTRAKSNNALLNAIKLTPASILTNTGTTGTTTTYTTSVSNATTSVTVTATAQDATATIKVKGVAVASGTASGSIALAVGSNTITTVVTAQDGTTTHTYSIAVTRASGPLMSLYMPVSVVQPTDNLSIENDGVMLHQGVSPNGDGMNDFLTIDGIAAYPDNRLTIIDRNGTLIFQAKGYNNISKVFDGHSGINGKLLQTGTYFYSLDYSVNGQSKHKTGFILLKY